MRRPLHRALHGHQRRRNGFDRSRQRTRDRNGDALSRRSAGGPAPQPVPGQPPDGSMSARGGPRRSSGQVRSGRPGRRRRDSIADDASPGHASADDPHANDPNSVTPTDTQLDAPGRRRAVITEPVAYDVPTRGPRIRSALLSRWTIAATVLIWV